MKKKLFEQSDAMPSSQKAAAENQANLVALQADILMKSYHTACFDVKQLQEVLRVGESNVYQLIRSGKLRSQTVGRRKIVPVVYLAQFLVLGNL